MNSQVKIVTEFSEFGENTFKLRKVVVVYVCNCSVSFLIIKIS